MEQRMIMTPDRKMLTINTEEGLGAASDSRNVPGYALIPPLVCLLGGTDEQTSGPHNQPKMSINMYHLIIRESR